MFNMKSCLLCWLLFVISIHNAFSQDPLPILQLYEPDLNNTINNSGCKDCLLDDVDFFTVRGKVNKNGANPDAYVDTNLYIQAVKDPSTNDWTFQCQLDITVCASDLNKDCYCERKDKDGWYYLVMTIKAKMFYSGGELMLSWNDKRSPFNRPVTSNIVNYYPGSIKDPNVTETGRNENNITDLTTEELVGIIFGSIFAIIVLVAVIALIVFWIRRENARKKNRNRDTDQNVKPLDPNYLAVKPTHEVPKTEIPNQETEHAHNNLAFGDYIEPVEPDYSGYSEIDMDVYNTRL